MPTIILRIKPSLFCSTTTTPTAVIIFNPDSWHLLLSNPTFLLIFCPLGRCQFTIKPAIPCRVLPSGALPIYNQTCYPLSGSARKYYVNLPSLFCPATTIITTTIIFFPAFWHLLLFNTTFLLI